MREHSTNTGHTTGSRYSHSDHWWKNHGEEGISGHCCSSLRPETPSDGREIFGPIASITSMRMLINQHSQVADEASPYALTGAIFSNDRYAIQEALSTLQNAAGRPTSMTNQQEPLLATTIRRSLRFWYQ